MIEHDSPWGKLRIADAHVHFFSPGFFKALATQKGVSVEEAGKILGWIMPREGPADALAENWIQELNRHHVEQAALISSIPGDEASVIAAGAAYPDRFFKYAMVDPVHPWQPERFVEIDALCLFPAMHCFSLHSAEARRVFKWAAANGKAVFVHCGMLSVGVRRKLGLESRFDMRYSSPLDLHPLALEYSTVPFIVPHFGAGMFRETLMVADACPNVYLDTSSSNAWTKYLESPLDLRHVFKRALDVVGPQRLLFGTDSSFFPRGWHAPIFDHQATALYEIGVTAADAQAIFGGNLKRIYSR